MVTLLFDCTTHSFACSALLAALARSALSFACSLTSLSSSLVGQWMIVWLFILCFFLFSIKVPCPTYWFSFLFMSLMLCIIYLLSGNNDFLWFVLPGWKRLTRERWDGRRNVAPNGPQQPHASSASGQWRTAGAATRVITSKFKW